ncbi:MAG TPA: acyloxyacyl hydrolase [Candidatus Binatia bacterium]|nr:acyloxyacyl hydrolase [Candidatus Binatia bacterium]
MKTKYVLGLPLSVVPVVSFLLPATLIFCTPLHSAEPSQGTAQSSYALLEGTNEFGLWVGGSPDSTRSIGKTEDRKLLLVALRYGRVLAAWESTSLEYTLDIFPAAVVFVPEDAGRSRSTIYGAGISPLGLKLNFGQQSWIKPFVGASVGFLYFEDDVPVPRSSRFNFTPEIGLGLQFFLSPKNAATVGYKFHHISNANTGRRNPGMDSHVFYAGFSFFTP